MTINDKQIPISGKKCSHQNKAPKNGKPTKRTNPPNQKYHQKITLRNWKKEIGMCTDKTKP